jgi:gliding motility-associated lipoprotein GldB
MRITLTGAFALLLFLLSGCHNDPLDVDVSTVNIEVTFKRLDQDLFSLNPAAGQTNTAELYTKYGQFLIDYSEGVLRIGNPESESYSYAVAQFITDENMKSLYRDVQDEFNDVSIIENELTDAFKFYRYHFPDSTVPDVVFNISALNYAVVATQTTLAIGLDMFLGADYPVYPLVGLPKYMYTNMKPNQVVPQAMKGWVQSMYETDALRNNLLEHMIFEGKLLYAMDALLRETEDSLKVGFSPEEMAWCKEYEPRIWAHLVDQELLYTTEYMDINKWINQAPFVAGIPKNSPGRLGQWVGWQIVRFYMKNNPQIPITELMTNQNAQEILAKSKYKPKL